MQLVTDAAVRCAPWTREQGVDPIGSMGIYRSFLLVEWPLPWPRDLSEVAALGELGPQLSAERCRLQALVPRALGPTRRVVRYLDEGAGRFRRFSRVERVVDATEVVATARQLLSQTASVPGTTDGREVLICTHGRRDRCCGSLGTELALELAADPDCLGAATQVWRTSHTGGHRFAPTAMIFPEGTGWAFVDLDVLSKVVDRRGPITDVLEHYRGCAGLGSPRIQAVEREVLGEVGWELFDLARWGSEEDDGTVRLHVEQGGDVATWEAKVQPGRVLPVPECGAPVAQARKTNTEQTVSGLRRVS